MYGKNCVPFIFAFAYGSHKQCMENALMHKTLWLWKEINYNNRYIHIFSFAAVDLYSYHSKMIIIFKSDACKIKCIKEPFKSILVQNYPQQRAIASHQRLLTKKILFQNGILNFFDVVRKKILFNLWFCSIKFFYRREKKAHIFQHCKKYKFY